MRKILSFISAILFVFLFLIGFAFFDFNTFIITGGISIVGLVTSVLLLQIELKIRNDKHGMKN